MLDACHCNPVKTKFLCLCKNDPLEKLQQDKLLPINLNGTDISAIIDNNNIFTIIKQSLAVTIELMLKNENRKVTTIILVKFRLYGKNN